MAENQAPFFQPFRVLLERDEKYNTYVAHCLETGSVVTADNKSTVKDMIRELLEDEISYAIVHSNLKNLLSSPAPVEIWRKWATLATQRKPEVLLLNIEATPLNLGEPEVTTEVKVASAAN